MSLNNSIASNVLKKLGDQAGSMKTLVSLVLERLQKAMAKFPRIPGALGLTKVLVAFSAIYTLNKALTHRVVGGRDAKNAFKRGEEIILITGGSSGMGLVMAEMFAKQGIKVAVIDINGPKGTLPAGVKFYQGDVTSPESLHKAAESIRYDLGHPSVIINNAGLLNLGSIINIDPAKVQRLLNVNVTALFLVSKEFLPAMVERNHGHVVTIASMASYVAIAGMVDYAASKAAALAFHEGLTQELKHRYDAPRIRTTVVNPSWVRTPMTAEIARHATIKGPMIEPDTVASAVVKQVISGRGGQLMLPWDISYLASLRGFPIWLQEYFRSTNAGILHWTHV
ncbi:hypothetical protein PFICI_13345 [Pestalotiopsis fici W106-1]|uniref:Short-chain dehydrogenase/reductase 3 n=1 Tax=Pestalotiopsis fici (strain W106-1 / CGMCC3.15140) TaxID=1229662 RepID=W3WPW7_PESFW|nr:uncharacterized protein PFICI_13345 [Pestalotiopsis fici W106-1]ETS74861.1 hypothetical protein PFICI_13345 [Pestalotiopsis fici W106-1]